MMTEIDIENHSHRLYPRMYAHVTLELERHPDAIRLPVGALGGSGQGQLCAGCQRWPPGRRSRFPPASTTAITLKLPPDCAGTNWSSPTQSGSDRRRSRRISTCRCAQAGFSQCCRRKIALATGKSGNAPHAKKSLGSMILGLVALSLLCTAARLRGIRSYYSGLGIDSEAGDRDRA